MDVSKTMTANLSQPGQFTIFLGMVQTVHYDSLLRIAKYHTLFLPDNASLAKDEAMIDKLSMPQLKELVEHHIVEGTIMSSDLIDGKRLKTLAGDELIISNKEDTIRIGSIRITKPNQLSNNGVIHVVSGLLRPDK